MYPRFFIFSTIRPSIRAAAFMFCSVVFAATANSQLIVPPSITEQAESPKVPPKPLIFEVVSIRPSLPGSVPGGFSITPDGYRQNRMPLIFAIMMAYFPMANIPLDRIKGAPSWIMDDPYDIVAKVPEADIPVWRSLNQGRVGKGTLEVMLQQVLRERCHLVTHQEPDEVRGYGIVVRKPSRELKLAGPAFSIPPAAIPIAGEAMLVPPSRGRGKQELTFFHTSMSALALYLTQEAKGIRVEDHTSLDGFYNFTLPRRPAPISGLQDGIAPEVDYDLPWDIRAVGLDLRSIKISQWKLMVDHIERPSQN